MENNGWSLFTQNAWDMWALSCGSSMGAIGSDPDPLVVPLNLSAAAHQGGGVVKRSKSGGGGEARCQVEGCKVGLENAKGYHRKHKVMMGARRYQDNKGAQSLLSTNNDFLVSALPAARCNAAFYDLIGESRAAILDGDDYGDNCIAIVPYDQDVAALREEEGDGASGAIVPYITPETHGEEILPKGTDNPIDIQIHGWYYCDICKMRFDEHRKFARHHKFHWKTPSEYRN
nr:SBP-box transcription factor [Ipomoea batatas]